MHSVDAGGNFASGWKRRMTFSIVWREETGFSLDPRRATSNCAARNRGGEPMGDLDRQRRLADAANALERRDPLFFSARLFARSSDQGRLEDLLRSLLGQARSLIYRPSIRR
jgi:hypothetical protein